MKIFNWVQRRFHHDALKDGLARNVKKAESITNEADKLASLKQAALVDVLDGWKDGILTIGTLGLDPLKPFNNIQKKEYFVLETEEEEEEDDDDDYNDDEEEQEQYSLDSDDSCENVIENEDDEEEEEENPLIFTRFEHNFEEIRLPFDVNTVKSDLIMTIDPMDNNSSIVHGNDQRERKGERITLAELFLADSDVKKKSDCFDQLDQPESSSSKKPVIRGKNGLSFAKKYIPRVGDDSRPIKKFHQLMRRMLKRKIHPEFEGKGCKTDNLKANQVAESVSLLRTPQGPTI